MIPFYQPQAACDIYRLSDGLAQHRREEGFFEVRCGRADVRKFSELSGAALFYLRYPGAAAIYDTTEGETLIERKIYVSLS